MFQKIIHFIKYHNAFTIGLGLVLLLTGGAMADDNVRNAVIGEKIITENGIDNSQILAADLDNFDLNLQITGVSEDDENYYVNYTYQTLAIKDNVWQLVIKEQTLTVSKKELGNKDLGLYVQEELSEVANYEISYLKEVQKIEREKGMTKLVASVDYTGLIGLVLDIREKILPGYKPVITEEVCDGKDNDRDGLIDEDLGEVCCGMGTCLRCVDNCLNGVSQTCTPGMPTSEICDGLDNDCDDLVDEDLGQTTCGIGACQVTVNNCLNSQLQICTPKSPTEEKCDGIDNDCDGEVDEDNVCQPVCQPTTEICDGIDNDCDGEVDEDLGQTTCGIGACQVTLQDCLNGIVQICTPLTPTQEICDDGIDNDCDGKIDGEDENCQTAPPTPSAPVCTPNWSCPEWQPTPSSIACGQTFNQTRTCTDLNNCGTEEGKPTESQEAIGSDATACGTTSCDVSLNLAGECQNTCLEKNCQTCTPPCTCATGFSDCDGDLTNGCETPGDCLPVEEPEE